MNDIPIVVMSFNRPEYLSRMLDSLAAQTALGDKPVYLFQDGAISPHTNLRHAEDADIEACIDVFRAKFPEAVVKRAPHNLGIGENFRRAEEFVFNELRAEIGYFFEDDMVLSPHYLTMLDRIWGWAANVDRVGYFAAFGPHSWPLEKQRAYAHKLGRMSYHWAYALTRRHWLALNEWLQPYYDMTAGHDYASRPVLKIADYYRSVVGAPVVAVNQDMLKKTGTYMLGRVQLMTFACYGKYIGAKGVHFSSGEFADKKFEDTVLYPEPVELQFPSDEQIEMLHQKEMADRRGRVAAALKAKEEKRRLNEERRAAARAEKRGSDTP